MSSRKIKPEESKVAEKNNVQPYQTAVAIDAIVPIIHPDNKIQNLSLEDLRKIYKGQIRNWEQVGGKDAPIVLVSNNPNAIGYIGFGYINPTIKAVNVNGIHAEAATASSGKWPLSRELYLYTNGAPKDSVKKLIDYCLDQKGQKLVKETGFVPLK